MRGSRPLPDTNPELLVLDAQDLCREYRVENWHLARDGSGRVIRGASGLTWLDGVLVAVSGVLWRSVPSIQSHSIAQAAAVLMLILLVYYKCTQVLWESILVFPSHGIQLETHRGFPPYPLLASRRFIPILELQDLIINEGLRGWAVRYYLAAMYQPPGPQRLAVAYENILPLFPVLHEVYVGVHAYLQSNMGNYNETT
ncbi:hypothetical protein FA95DRAFT_1480209 [Auriscalpium vulgare]|uniref:Uncharacterized protein n=1 Tax=Auriscalpium vulgare TaxID=40419 RepID=A0ACB8SCH5_9AGAM|nr:hypothetical protein FA95DRAFT_1480209 [Auriscalpium vulgare]